MAKLSPEELQSAYDLSQKEVKNLTKQLEDTTQREDVLKKANEALTAENEKLKSANDSLNNDLAKATSVDVNALQQKIEELEQTNNELNSLKALEINGKSEVLNFNAFDLTITPAATEEVPEPKPVKVSYIWRSAGHGQIIIPGEGTIIPDEIMALPKAKKEARLLALVTEHPSLFEEVIK